MAKMESSQMQTDALPKCVNLLDTKQLHESLDKALGKLKSFFFFLFFVFFFAILRENKLKK